MKNPYSVLELPRTRPSPTLKSSTGPWPRNSIRTGNPETPKRQSVSKKSRRPTIFWATKNNASDLTAAKSTPRATTGFTPNFVSLALGAEVAWAAAWVGMGGAQEAFAMDFEDLLSPLFGGGRAKRGHMRAPDFRGANKNQSIRSSSWMRRWEPRGESRPTQGGSKLPFLLGSRLASPSA